ncbi:hypothetical protein B5807_01309 [Epicoccum nigrum]|uniref:Uncharacterized protein n=1 Tax=Epicoccum nigrum TaxID=105696 RepID=A0A1Y2MG42_EPING|nr:hypothetical protein B5807_01309 [Epicoccum nigrum]
MMPYRRRPGPCSTKLPRRRGEQPALQSPSQLHGNLAPAPHRLYKNARHIHLRPPHRRHLHPGNLHARSHPLSLPRVPSLLSGEPHIPLPAHVQAPPRPQIRTLAPHPRHPQHGMDAHQPLGRHVHLARIHLLPPRGRLLLHHARLVLQRQHARQHRPEQQALPQRLQQVGGPVRPPVGRGLRPGEEGSQHAVERRRARGAVRAGERLLRAGRGAPVRFRRRLRAEQQGDAGRGRRRQRRSQPRAQDPKGHRRGAGPDWQRARWPQPQEQARLRGAGEGEGAAREACERGKARRQRDEAQGCDSPRGLPCGPGGGGGSGREEEEGRGGGALRLLVRGHQRGLV